MRNLAILFLTAFLVSASVVRAGTPPAVDQRADEAMTLFEKYCVVNGGARDLAVKLINGTPISKPLPESVVTDLQGGRHGGIGWLVATPHDGRVILAYDPIGVCEVAVVSADSESMRRAFTALLDKAGKQLNVPVVEGKAQSSQAFGLKMIATPFSFSFLGKTATLTLTTAEKTMPIGFQHTLTSTFAKK